MTTENIIEKISPFEGRINEVVARQADEIRSEMGRMESRVLRNLLDWMLPDLDAGPRPAHAILHAHPEAGQEAIHPEMETCAAGTDGTAYHFSPLLEMRLGQAEVAAIAFGEKLVPLTGGLRGGAPWQAELLQDLPAGETWLGISGWDGGDLRFFFDWENTSERGPNHRHLQAGEWFCGAQKMTAEQGAPEADLPSDGFSWLERRSPNDQLAAQIDCFYQPFFFNLRAAALPPIGEMPAQLQAAFPAASQKLVGLHWLCLRLPKGTPKSWHDGLTVALNCFPVVQRRLHTVTHNFAHLPIFSLGVPGEKFLAMERVDGAAEYPPRQFFSPGDEPGWQVCRGNMERPALPDQPEPPGLPYLRLRPRNRESAVTLKFWTTRPMVDGEVQKFCEATHLVGQAWLAGTTQFVTIPVGWQDEPDLTAKWLKTKSLALSRGRIVTPQDVRCWVVAKLGKAVERVDIGHGVDRLPGQGAFRTCAVRVVLLLPQNEAANWTETRRKSTAFELENELNQHSSGMLPFRVEIA